LCVSQPAGFGTLLAHARPATGGPTTRKAATGDRRAGHGAAREPAAARPVKRQAAKPRPDDSAARARLQEAKRMLSAAQAEERQAPATLDADATGGGE